MEATHMQISTMYETIQALRKLHVCEQPSNGWTGVCDAWANVDFWANRLRSRVNSIANAILLVN
jgi:hypothetical protein